MPRLPRSFFRRDAVTVARELLGMTLVHRVAGRRVAGRIVETEAYLGVEDAAAHTFRGRRTPRNETMYHDGGCLYVYFTYGMHHCANVVASREGDPVAVLLRALEPLEGLDFMRQQRPKARRDVDLCSGPAKLCAALGVTREHNGVDLVASPDLFITPPGSTPGSKSTSGGDIVARPRIGIDYAGGWRDKPLRFYLRGNPHVSKP